MDVTKIINKSGLSLEEKMNLKLLCSTNTNLKAMIENDEELNDDLLLLYLERHNHQQQTTGKSLLLFIYFYLNRFHSSFH